LSLQVKEYQVKFRYSSDMTFWVERSILIAMGAEKMVMRFDEKVSPRGLRLNDEQPAVCVDLHRS
jgi:hypothetical protein